MTLDQELTPEIINSLKNNCNDFSSESFIKTVLEMRDSGLEEYLLQLKNYRVIELGPGNNPITNFYQCGEYIGVQPFTNANYPEFKIVDALSFLKGELNSSAIIVSFGVMDEDILVGKSMFTPLKILGFRYMKELGNEIKRVSNPFSIIVGASTGEILGTPDYAVKNWDAELGFGGVYTKNKLEK